MKLTLAQVLVVLLGTAQAVRLAEGPSARLARANTQDIARRAEPAGPLASEDGEALNQNDPTNWNDRVARVVPRVEPGQLAPEDGEDSTRQMGTLAVEDGEELDPNDPTNFDIDENDNPQVNPQANPQVNPQANPQVNPQVNPQANPQVNPQIVPRGALAAEDGDELDENDPTNWADRKPASAVVPRGPGDDDDDKKSYPLPRPGKPKPLPRPPANPDGSHPLPPPNVKKGGQHGH